MNNAIVGLGAIIVVVLVIALGGWVFSVSFG